MDDRGPIDVDETVPPTLAVGSNLRDLLRAEKMRYLEARRQQGGTAEGFRQRIRAQYAAEELKFTALVLDALMEAATKSWQAPPRKRGPDLFSISDVTIPETLTRPAAGYVTGDEIEGDAEELFEKVDYRYATVNDLEEDAKIKLRKAAQSSAAAERLMRAVDTARARARGDMSALLKDVCD
jgi:hypothetical protein